MAISATDFMDMFSGVPSKNAENPGQAMTPAQLEDTRAWARGLMQPSAPGRSGPYEYYGKWNAIADALRGGIGGYAQYQAGQAELAARNQAAQGISQAFAPYLGDAQNTRKALGGYEAHPATNPLPSLAQDRQRFAAELQSTPGLKDKMFAIAAGENQNPSANLAVIESAMNRASMMGTTLAQEMRRTSENGYYAGWNPGAASHPQLRHMMESNLSNALAGSNMANFATDNASDGSTGFASRRIQSGMFNPTAQYNGEYFMHPNGPDARGSGAPYQNWLASVAPKQQRTAMAGPGTATDAAYGSPSTPMQGNLQSQPPAAPMQGNGNMPVPGGGMPNGGNMPMQGGGAAPQPGIPAGGPNTGLQGGGAAPPMAPQSTPQPSGNPQAGLPQTLTAPAGIDSQGLTKILSNPWIPDTEKAAIMQLVQSRVQPQTLDTVGGKLMYNLQGQQAFIPEPKFSAIKIGGNDVPIMSTYDPRSGQWNHQMMTPGANGQLSPSGGNGATAPGSYGMGEPNLSSIGGMAQFEANQASAKGYAEEQGRSYAKRFESLSQAATAAQNELPQLQLLSRALDDPNFYSGFAAHNIQQMDSALKSAGLGTGQRASIMQLASKLGSAGTLENLGEMRGLGQIRNPEIELLRQSNFSPENTVQANKAVVELRSRLAQRQVDTANMASDYANAHGGRIDRGFDQMMRDRYTREPLVSDAELKNYQGLLGGRSLPPSATGTAAQTPMGQSRVIDGVSYIKGQDGQWYKQ